MSRSTSQAPKARGSFSTVAAFLFGVPAGLGLLYFLHHGESFMPEQMKEYLPQVLQYVEHPVEMTEVVMFCCAIGAMVAKLIASWGERAARRAELLPAWDGKPVAVEDAAKLSEQLAQRSGLLRNSYLGRRVANILEFVQSRGSANELDD